jgi:hypothetical protein
LKSTASKEAFFITLFFKKEQKHQKKRVRFADSLLSWVNLFLQRNIGAVSRMRIGI